MLLALALFALALPIVGPLDDHHFAERWHTHEHIFPDGRPVQHQHVFEGNLRHWHAVPDNSATSGETPPGIYGVAYLTGATASLVLAITNAPYHSAPEPLRPPSTYDEDANPLLDFASHCHRPEERNPPPPLPPPIA